MREAFGATFIGPEGYLNTASYGLPPTATVDALERVHRRWAAGTAVGSDFDADIATGRAAFADLAGVPVSSVTMGASVAALLGPVASALPDGARVLVPEGEFTSVSFPFAAHHGRDVTVTEAPLHRLPEAASEYDVVAVSTVQSADGARVDLTALRSATEGSDTIVLLDATQQLGWLQLDLGWADVVVSSSYKWLLGPTGIAWGAYSDHLVDRLVPHHANRYAGGAPWDTTYGLPLRLTDDARRFDISPAWFPVVGAAASLAWISTLDIAEVTAHCRGLADRARTALGLPPGDSAIVSIPTEHAAARLQEAGVRASVRQGAARIAFALYNTEDDLDRVVRALNA
ncbi:aminotransferase class V-fold PLP-dependent enzyme [Aeromicrobium senzhongii]|uniref:Aminotransferase class V-fold PLP-dependent enzyme n=1 Tax=Aeromicrobium senzhongii TaxID=2663859 RepID=A0ABX6SU87_9ACTN|nr:aminotransferase class V-fold PLP-dependent enzyme [Aeromicrobium senzhongii]MTB88902.1 aminotransferase class V-fold PLP-dependent enzyme [Aeromicrobium senzhongii]QNL93815.1 aminotransferase class V-fold PLP-dependent enzyme [Aeromicrobium senzhongii]